MLLWQTAHCFFWLKEITVDMRRSLLLQVCTLELLLAVLAQEGQHADLHHSKYSACAATDVQSYLLYSNYHWSVLRQDETSGTWKLRDDGAKQTVDNCGQYLRQFAQVSENRVFPLRQVYPQSLSAAASTD